MTPRSALLVALLLVSNAALAKLPLPTPAEQAAQAERRAREEAQLKIEKAQLEKSQDAVAERYRREHPGASAPQPAGGVSDKNMPKSATDLPGSAAPQGGNRPGAEAHSAPAK